MLPSYLFSKIPKFLIKTDEYQEFKYNYFINNSLKESCLSIRKEYLQKYNYFYIEFTEVEYNNSVIYIRECDSFITYDSPLFILISLIENKIDFDFRNYICWENDGKKIKILGINSNFDKIILNLYIKSKLIVILLESQYLKNDDKKLNEIIKIKNIKYSSHLLSNNDYSSDTDQSVQSNESNEVKIVQQIVDKQDIIDKLKKEVIIESNYDEINKFKIDLFNYLEESNEIPDIDYFNTLNDIKEIKEEIYNNIVKDFIDNKFNQNNQNILEVNYTNKTTNHENISLYNNLLYNLILRGEVTLQTKFIEFFEEFYVNNKTLFDSISERELVYAFNNSKLSINNLINNYFENRRKQFESFLLFNLFSNHQYDSLIKLTLLEIKNKFKIINISVYQLVINAYERKSLLNKFLNYFNYFVDFYHFCSKDEDNSSMNIVKTPSKVFNLHNIPKIFFLLFLKQNISSEISWEESLKKFNDYDQFEYKDYLSLPDKKEIFSSVILDLRSYHKQQYRQLLAEKIGMNNEINWYDAQMTMQNDKRYKAVLEKDREEIFTQYTEKLFNKIESDFIQLVEEAEYINKNTNIDTNDYELILYKLSKDIRGKRMMKYPERRDKHIKAKVRRLNKFTNKK